MTRIYKIRQEQTKIYSYLFLFEYNFIKSIKGGNYLKKIIYKIKNEFKKDDNMTEEELKLLFNKKLLKVILSIEKSDYGRCNF